MQKVNSIILRELLELLEFKHTMELSDCFCPHNYHYKKCCERIDEYLEAIDYVIDIIIMDED